MLKPFPRQKTTRKKSGHFFRVRFGDYRLGYEKKTDEIIVYRILHRKEIILPFHKHRGSI